MKIYQLPDKLANKIAAGEVVERPASVVKELVENSIDANSSWIKIDVVEAGMKQIKVIDNGVGMSEEDCEKAFLRHATSKIRKETDLFHIKSLGFRGEALASIASVSKLSIKTSQGDKAGTVLEIEGGKVINKRKADARQGTEINVQHLFFNTPARLKYMKTIHTELSHITDCLNRMALSHPNIRFELIHNGKSIFKTPGNDDLQQVIAIIYGIDVAKKMIRVKKETLDFIIEGYISLPEVNRASKSYISTIINGRYIKSHPLVHAIHRAYHTLLPIHRSPIVVLSIEMDPILVDVNVHPTKLEVRFSKEKELISTIETMITEAFQKHTLIPKLSKEKKQEQTSFQPTFNLEPKRSKNIQTSTFEKIDFETKETITKQQEIPNLQRASKKEFVQENNPKFTTIDNENSSEQDKKNRLPVLYPIGQFQGTYILAQNENGLYILDQHAAQERIKYEYYLQKLSKPAEQFQQLFLPLTFEFSKEESIFIEKHKETFKQIGIVFEPFGSNSYVIRSHPSWFPKESVEDTIRNMVDQIMQTDQINIENLIEETAILMACKRSIKANQYLKYEEMESLIEHLRKTKKPFTCPHGRPVIIHFTSYEMEKMFKRIM